MQIAIFNTFMGRVVVVDIIALEHVSFNCSQLVLFVKMN